MSIFTASLNPAVMQQLAAGVPAAEGGPLGVAPDQGMPWPGDNGQSAPVTYPTFDENGNPIIVNPLGGIRALVAPPTAVPPGYSISTPPDRTALNPYNPGLGRAPMNPNGPRTPAGNTYTPDAPSAHSPFVPDPPNTYVPDPPGSVTNPVYVPDPATPPGQRPQYVPDAPVGSVNNPVYVPNPASPPAGYVPGVYPVNNPYNPPVNPGQFLLPTGQPYSGPPVNPGQFLLDPTGQPCTSPTGPAPLRVTYLGGTIPVLGDVGQYTARFQTQYASFKALKLCMRPIPFQVKTWVTVDEISANQFNYLPGQYGVPAEVFSYLANESDGRIDLPWITNQNFIQVVIGVNGAAFGDDIPASSAAFQGIAAG